MKQMTLSPPHPRGGVRVLTWGLSCLVPLLPLATAQAEERPSDDDLFGAPAAPAPAPTPAEAGETRADETLFGAPSTAATPSAASALSAEVAPEDPLRLGGQLYTRMLGTLREETRPGKLTVSYPTLVDLYVDARPNDRVRGMVIGRLQYNPLQYNVLFPGVSFGAYSATSTSVLLNQLWVNFDVDRKVFITAGRQFTKWGTGRFWNPTDYLQPTRRDPLEPFDVRTGADMVKFHVPYEKLGWNFYAVALLENLTPVPSIERTGVALRAETVFGSTELGLDALLARYQVPRLGLDLSSGLGPVDVRAEVGIRPGKSFRLWRPVENPVSEDLADQYEQYTLDGWVPQASVGLDWQRTIGDDDVLTLGGETFINPLAGYDDASLYPWLIFQGAYNPFYTGKYYGALFASLGSPGKWSDASLTFSTIGNLSDLSFVSRLDFSNLLLTHLRLEAYAAAYYGTRGGEFKLALDTEAQELNGQSIPAIKSLAPMLDVGLSLRLSI